MIPEALAMVAERAPEVLLLDVHLPGRGGMAVLEGMAGHWAVARGLVGDEPH